MKLFIIFLIIFLGASFSAYNFLIKPSQIKGQCVSQSQEAVKNYLNSAQNKLQQLKEQSKEELIVEENNPYKNLKDISGNYKNIYDAEYANCLLKNGLK